MTNFAAIKAFGRLCRDKYPVVHAVIGQVDMTGKGYVWVNEDVSLSPERHNMRQVGLFYSQGDGSNRGYQFTKIGNITRKNGVWNFWVDIRENNAGGRSDKRRDFNVLIVVFKSMQDGMLHLITRIHVHGYTAVRNAGGRDNAQFWHAFGESPQVIVQRNLMVGVKRHAILASHVGKKVGGCAIAVSRLTSHGGQPHERTTTKRVEKTPPKPHLQAEKTFKKQTKLIYETQ